MDFPRLVFPPALAELRGVKLPQPQEALDEFDKFAAICIFTLSARGFNISLRSDGSAAISHGDDMIAEAPQMRELLLQLALDGAYTRFKELVG